MIISTQAPRTPRPLRPAPLCLADHLERGPWTSAAAAVPSAEQQQQPPRTITNGRKTREAPAIGCWNVLEGVIASRQHPRRASEPVSRVVDPPSSSRRRHHPPVESKTSLPLPKNPTVSSQASRRPGARHPCFFFPRSVARPRHLGECNAPWLPRPSPSDPTAPPPGPRLALSAFALSLALAAATVAVRRVVPSCPPCCPEQGAFLGRGSTRLHANSGRRRSLLLPTSLVLLLLLGSACVRVAACCVLRALLENTERLVDSTPLLPSSHSSPSPDPPTYLLPPHPTPLLPGCDTLVAASFRG